MKQTTQKRKPSSHKRLNKSVSEEQKSKTRFQSYVQQAKDALATGDKILAEHYWQHADHYYRCFNKTP